MAHGNKRRLLGAVARCWLASGFAAIACLPDDTRGTPGRLTLTFAGDAAAQDGFRTSDGWQVRYERLLVVAGGVVLDGDGCDEYAENDYSRIFDATELGPQRAGTFYGLGRCDIRFLVSPPGWDTLLGDGVGEADAIALGTPGTDAHAKDAGVSVLAEGTAEKLGQVKRFEWPFRRFIEYDECRLEASGGELERGVSLDSGGEVQFELAARGEALFASSSDEDPPLSVFEPFFAADAEHGDGDGSITLDELERTPWTGEPEPDGRTWATLGERVYLGALPHIVRYRGTGTCTIRSSAEEPDGDGPF